MGPSHRSSSGRPQLLRRLWSGFVWGGALVAAAHAAFAAEPPAPDAEAGRRAYAQSCARCHGAEGKGDGVDAKRFYPRPRDLTLGVYKFRSTASGTPPTDQDLLAILTNGLPGSNMPDWQHLSEETRWQLVHYLKSLAPIFAETSPAPVTLSADPGPKRVNLEQGKAVFEKLGCASCHGAQGRANGTSASGLVDDWGMSTRPADLTQPWGYRGGHEPKDIMMRMMAGIDGAGMPSYAEAMTPEEGWQLAYYVHSLQQPPEWNMIAHAAKVDGALPSAPDDVRWRDAQRTDLRLRNAVRPDGTWETPGTIRAVTLHALYNSDRVALRLTWHDPTQEGADAEAADAAAVVFKPTTVHGDVVTLQAWPYDGAPALDWLAWSAKRGQAVEAVTDSYEQLAAITQPTPALHGAAHYEDGEWQLVLQRPLVPTVEGAAQLETGVLTSIAFVIWNGADPQTRAVSSWIELVLGPNDPAAAHAALGDAHH